MLSLEKQNELRERYREAHPGWRPATEIYAEFVRHELHPLGRLLDLGCGRGGLIEQLDHPLSLTVGLDLDLLSLRLHRLASGVTPLPRVASIAGDLPFSETSFDLIIASWVLEHLHQPLICFREIRRVLQPGGAFIFITPNLRHPLVRLNRLIGRLPVIQGALVSLLYGKMELDRFRNYYRANSPRELTKLAEAANLRLARLEMIADPTYLSLTPKLYNLAGWLESKLPEERTIHLVGRMVREL